jgi:hypothetical protein
LLIAKVDEARAGLHFPALFAAFSRHRGDGFDLGGISLAANTLPAALFLCWFANASDFLVVVSFPCEPRQDRNRTR